MEDFLKELNDAQRQAVTLTEGSVRVIAGAGTGKTRALIHRFCYLVSALGISPRNILCVTFTNRAANEMKLRIRRALGDCDLGFICTFHAFCVQLLKEEIYRLNFPKNFVILDVEDEKQILSRIFEEMKLSLRETSIRKVIDDVLEAKKMTQSYMNDLCFCGADELMKRARLAVGRDEAIFLRYLYEQKKCYGCDFNDLINFALYILEHHEDARLKWQRRMQYVMVDEFQDVSGKQYEIARILSALHGNLFVVGDPDQTIYFWRGAHVEMILDFEKAHPGARTVSVLTNYRSTPEILAAANCLISKNTLRFSKSLTAVRPSGPKPLYFHAKNEQEEARWICKNIAAQRESGVSLKDMAVLYRAHYLTRFLEECFIENRLPYKIYSGVEFYGRREIKDAVCYLRMLTAADDIAFERTVNRPSRKIGKVKMALLRKAAAGENVTLYEALKKASDAPFLRGTGARRYIAVIEHLRESLGTMKLGDLLQTLLDLSGYEEMLCREGDQERLDNMAEFKRSVAKAEQDELSLPDFLDRVALFSNTDQEERDAVKLMTVHAAKGNEFSCVFLCGFSEGIFPSRKIDTPEEMEEERRLAYVAMTRAMDRLYISDSAGMSNDNLFKYPSRFLFDAGEENLDYEKPLEQDLAQSASGGSKTPDEAARSLGAAEFAVGARVNHRVFGQGTVRSVNRSEFCYVIQFDGMATERSLKFDAPLALL